jgi:mannose/fructose/N-acetylgalactosamine-specific phosphotransferase system component IIC
MNPAKIKKIIVLIPTFALAILLVQQNYSWIFGILIGVAVALTSCEMIQKAVNNSFVRKTGRTAKFFLVGFLFRFIFLGGLLFLAIIYFKVNVIALTVSFTVVQLLYPFYLTRSLENQKQNV